MSVATEISRLQADRNRIRNKLVEIGIAGSTDNLSALADAIVDIVIRGAVSIELQEGESYTIPAGIHNGSGTVRAVSGGGNYTVQAKNVTPTKTQQSVTPDEGYYALSSVTVAAIPDAYQDISSVTAAAGDVLANKIIVTDSGTVAGTMPNNGNTGGTIDGMTTTTKTIPAGYTSGGTVSLDDTIENALSLI